MIRASRGFAALTLILLSAGGASADHGRRRGGLQSASCLAKYGRLKCGFGCVAHYGRIECAKTPMGVCEARYGRVSCWDPQPRRRQLRRAEWILRRRAGRARCISKFGRIKCGYNCVAHYGRIECSKTPLGVCKAAYGHITCWDPPWARTPRPRRAVSHDRPSCVSAYGRSKCGFGCIAKYGRLECSRKPGARCIAQYGRIKCGYNCVAKHGRIECSKTPMGVCKAAYGHITCWDPRSSR